MPNHQPHASQALSKTAPGELPADPAVAYRSYLAGYIKSMWQLTNGIFGRPALRVPREVSVKACFIDGDEATLETTGKIDGNAVCGRVVLRRYAGEWHVSSEDYKGCAPEGYCLNIP